MHLSLTVVGPRAATDVVVEADPGSPAGAAVPGLAAAAGLPAGTDLECQGRAVDDHLVLGLPPLVDGAVLRAVVRAGGGAANPTPVPGAASALGAVEVRVVAGPDAGAVHRLGLGDHSVGRAAGCTIRVDDPALSREHARIVVRDDGVDVVDAGSTNGTSREDDADGSVRIRLAGTTLLLRPPPPDDPAASRPLGDGTVALSRSPRRPVRIPEVTLTVPPPPERREPGPVPWLAALLPLVVSVPLAVLWGPTALLLGLMSPVLLLGTAWADRRSAAADHARRRTEHAGRVDALTQQHEAACAQEKAARLAAAPDPATVGELARGRRRGLWGRAPSDEDHLLLRLGLGSVPSRVRVEHGAGNAPRGGAAPPWLVALDGDGRTDLVAVPLTVDLRDVGVLGVCGDPGAVAGLLRSLVTQVAVLHAPRDVGLAVLGVGAHGADDWGWCRWLPHTSGAEQVAHDGGGNGGGGLPSLVASSRADARALVARLAAEVRRRSEQTRRPDGGPPLRRLVVVVAGGVEPSRSPELVSVLEDGPVVGVLGVFAAADESGLPSVCGAVVSVAGAPRDGGEDLMVRLRDGDRALHGVGDRVASSWALDVARALAPLRDVSGPGSGRSLPRAVRLVDLLDGAATAGAREVRDRWAARPRSTAAVLGAATGDPWVVDLRLDGPHVLVAGTTGAGKSELLRTLVASLAWVNRPDEMQFVLVDFKGGAAFAGCADLPHTAGVVTDLDRHLTERALTSLRAEITRRERLLASHDAADLDTYLSLVDAGRAPRLPRLVVVVDEFRALAEELPDLLGALVRLAAVGRSLGLHLVLATQRPGGVVGADLRANVNLRIALRVRDAADSQDVVESPAAARIPGTLPGRAVARCGPAELVEVQAALASGTAPAARGVRVRRAGVGSDVEAAGVEAAGVEAAGVEAPRGELPENGEPGDTPPTRAASDGTPARRRASDRTEASDLSRLVAVLREAAAGSPRAASPWLPPLPSVLEPAVLEPAVLEPAVLEPADPTEPADRDGVTVGAAVLRLGLADLPHEQAQPPSRWDLAADGSLLVVGAPGSGRTGVLRAVVDEVAARSPDRVHLHVLDGGGGLRDAAALPHAGTVVERADLDRAVRLLELLAADVTRRRTLDAADLDHQPWVVLLVDGAEGLLGDLEEHAGGRGADLLAELVRSGPGARVVACLAGGRGLLAHRLATSVGARLVLRLADPADHLLAGVPSALAGGARPPGRAVRLGAGDPHEVQVSRVPWPPRGRPVPTPRGGPESDTGVGRGHVATGGPLRVPVMPVTLTLAEVLAARHGAEAQPSDRALLGVGGDDVRPLGLDLRGSCALVSGPAGSGRSTTLATLAASLALAGRTVLAVTPRGGPLAGTAGRGGPEEGARGTVTVTDGRDPAALAAALERAGAVLVDDADAIAGTAGEALLLRLADAVATRETGLVVAASPAHVIAHPIGLVAAARRHRTGVVLRPAGYADGDVLSVTLPRGGPSPPGRGFLVRDGEAVRLQVATATTTGSRREEVAPGA